MKNLRKISRESLKNVVGGITPECVAAQNAAAACYPTLAACQADPNSSDPVFGSFCMHICSRYCY